jgi:anti-anti-sigma regulatory factor
VLEQQWDMHLLDLHAGALPPRSLRGTVDAAAAADLEPRLLDHARSGRGTHVEFDCSELESIDRAGAAMLVRVGRRSGKVLRLTHLSADCALALRAEPAAAALELS